MRYVFRVGAEADVAKAVRDYDEISPQLDNAATAEQVQPLLPPSGWLTLVTSRFRFVVPGLEVLELGPMPADEARPFLAELSPRTAEVADDLLRLTGRLPLALRLAGSALAMRIGLSPAAYVRRLEKVDGLVDGVERTLAVSFDLFDAAQQTRWSMLAVFPGSFTAVAVAAVWEVNEDEAKDSLYDYMASSMVIFAEGRYRLHDLARVFAREHIIGPDVLRYRHAAFYVAALGSFDERYLEGHDGVLEGLRGFDIERRNIEAARTWLCQPGRGEPATRTRSEVNDRDSRSVFRCTACTRKEYRSTLRPTGYKSGKRQNMYTGKAAASIQRPETYASTSGGRSSGRGRRRPCRAAITQTVLVSSTTVKRSTNLPTPSQRIS